MNATLRGAAGSRIEFENCQLHRDGFFTCTATVDTGDGEWPAIELGMIDAYQADMLGFFELVAKDAINGSKMRNQWESEFAQLQLTADSDGEGAVTLRVYVRWKPTYEEERTGELEVRADAIERFAERLQTVLKLSHGERFRTAEPRRWRLT